MRTQPASDWLSGAKGDSKVSIYRQGREEHHVNQREIIKFFLVEISLVVWCDFDIQCNVPADTEIRGPGRLRDLYSGNFPMRKR